MKRGEAIQWMRGLVLRTPRPATEPRDGPTRNFHEIPKKYPRGRNSGTPRKYPENTEKIPQNRHFWYFWGIFRYFRGILGGRFWESRISGRGVFLRYFSWKFRVGPSRGSVAGRGVLKSGKDFYRKGNSVKSFGPFIEPPDSETLKTVTSLNKEARLLLFLLFLSDNTIWGQWTEMAQMLWSQA